MLGIWAIASGASLTAQNGDNPMIAYAGENLQEKIKKHLFIRVTTSSQSAYEGECVVAEYKLYVAVDLEGKLTRSPSYVGFASYDVPLSDAIAYTVEQKGNILYKVYTIKRVQLFALEPGVQQLQPIELEATVRFRKDPAVYGNFDADTLVPFTVRSSVVPVNILPLPLPQPAGFNGAVGNFELKAGMPADSQGASRSNAFVVQLSGKGNWHQVKLPSPTMPQGITLFEPAIQEELQPEVVPLLGRKSWTYQVTAALPGKYKLPGFSFVFFDPKARKYVSLSTDSFLLTLKDYKNPADKPGSVAKQIEPTEVFSTWAVIIFPTTALLLALGLAYIWWHRKKVAFRPQEIVSENAAAHTNTSTQIKPSQSIRQSYTKPVVNSRPSADRLRAYELQQEIQHWLRSNATHPLKEKAHELYTRTEALRYGPAVLYEAEIAELATAWAAFIEQAVTILRKPEE
jgi:hypothetical protein